MDRDLIDLIRAYVRAYVRRHGRQRAAEALGVSRHTLWRFLERGHVGRSLPRAVLNAVGETAEALEAATLRLVIDLEARRLGDALRSLPQGLEDGLLLLCAAPMATVGELSRFGRVPASTLRDRLEKLAERGLVDSLPHRLGVLGPHPQRRYFPTEKGVTAAGAATKGRSYFLQNYPVSRQWFRLLAERLDAVAVLYHVAALIADADPHGKPVRVDFFRQGPYDVLLTLSGGRSLGLLRQGPVLPSSNLRYRLRSMERLRYDERPTVTLILTYSDQATRRAIRSLGAPEHHTAFVATEGELIAGDAGAVVWQQCGTGLADNPPVRIAPDADLPSIVAWTDRLVDASSPSRRDPPMPNPDAIYPDDVRATMPDPSIQLEPALSVQLTRADKDALNLLAAWPLCTREQLAGLMGGVTRRRAGQTLRSLMGRGLVRSDGPLHVLTDDGLTFLARRDRAAVGLTLDRWSAEPAPFDSKAYAGTALRAIASQLRHQAGITDFAAALAAEVARSLDYELLDLLPTSRSAAGYWYFGTNYVVHPDASFLLEYRGEWRPCFLEFERRATTPPARARPPRILSPVLREQLGGPRPWREVSSRAIRVRVADRRRWLPERRRRGGERAGVQLQRRGARRARRPGPLMEVSAAASPRPGTSEVAEDHQGMTTKPCPAFPARGVQT